MRIHAPNCEKDNSINIDDEGDLIIIILNYEQSK